MMSGRKVLIAAVAAAGITQGALAADLPLNKAAPVDYVRVCDWTGVGYFYIPGTDTCLQVGGIMRSEYAFVNNSRALYPIVGAAGRPAPFTIIPGRDRDETGFLARARLALDARTKTAYGTLRAFIRYDIARIQGYYGAGGYAGGQTTYANAAGNTAFIHRAFITFAGITAGRVQSFYDFYADLYNYEGIASPDTTTNVLAYTYNATKELGFTLAVEDRNQRIGAQNLGNVLGGADAVAGAARYAGETVPDIVGVIRDDAAWGSAQISAAYHQVSSDAGPVGSTGGFNHSDTDGFAVLGGVHAKLPMLAAGDDLWLQASYEQGAYLYQSSGQYMNAGYNGLAVGGFQHIDHDAIALHIPGTAPGSYALEEVHGFSAMALVNHYFSPNFHDILFGSYEQTSYGARVKNIDWTLGGLGDASEYRIGNQFLWDPVKNLEFGLELDYIHIDQSLAHNVGIVATALPAGVSLKPDAFEGRLRVERDF